ncbi:ThuA domain-containing protein [Tautonia plasticadhaerens]|uniref:Trehalose utilization n=1 Tax=Tautonia plasticadhaerens TaxID=2527974 RepID=A0A518H2U9_9BACT|nr:ThuA domain-containing protein [Tautonia plasticadhaerens]QDV35161.1 Trehalose utilization [Tautonia plasticadhaerens]
MTLTRRRLLMASGAAALGASAMSRTLLGAQDGDRKRILYFTKSSGFQHSVINREADQLAHSETILIEVGKEHGFDVTASKDGRLFEPDRIDEWDGFVFYTTGDLTEPGSDGNPPMSPEGLEAFLEAIRSGRKGFVGIHCATDTFHAPPDEGPTPFVEMIGAEFITHGPQQVATVKVVDPDFPGAGPFGPTFEINDEWYAFRNMSDQIHAIMVQVTEGMQSGPRNDYGRPDYPNTWVKRYGEGRVFYTSMGHREDVWTNPKYQGLLIGGLNVATGRAEADFTPNVSEVTPGYQTLPG